MNIRSHAEVIFLSANSITTHEVKNKSFPGQHPPVDHPGSVIYSPTRECSTGSSNFPPSCSLTSLLTFFSLSVSLSFIPLSILSLRLPHYSFLLLLRTQGSREHKRPIGSQVAAPRKQQFIIRPRSP